MVEVTVYKVVVSRDGAGWLADVPSLAGAHTQAGNLLRLDEAIREVIALVEDLPDGAEPALMLAFEYEGLDEVAARAVDVGRRRADFDLVHAELVDETMTVARRMVSRGWSVRDVAHLLQISPGRVSQIRAQSRELLNPR